MARLWGARIPLLLGALLVAACARQPGPEAVALEYGRALYASDVETLYRLTSAEDRRARDEATFRAQHGQPGGFAGEAVRQLASFIRAKPLQTKTAGRRATVTLRFGLPDANASEITTLMYEWDDQRLQALSAGERARLLARLAELHRSGKLPILEGDETFELVKEEAGWRLFLNWAGGVRLRFTAAVPAGVPLRVAVTPGEIVVKPGEHLRITLRATNLGDRDVTTRVGHRIEPASHASSLALLQCPLFLPATLARGATEEFISEYLLLKDVPDQVKDFRVTYEFPLPRAGGS